MNTRKKIDSLTESKQRFLLEFLIDEVKANLRYIENIEGLRGSLNSAEMQLKKGFEQDLETIEKL